MAEGKKSFLMYADQIHIFESLEDDEAGRLAKHLLRYVNDQNPEGDKITRIAFEPIKQQLKRDLTRWEETSGKRANSGREGGLKSAEARRTKAKQIEANASKPKQNEHDNVNVNDIYNTVVSSFERITGKKIKLNHSRKSLINGRLKEGYKQEDFEKVFKIKNAEWKDSKDMKKHLTLETLLRASNFTKYFEQEEIKPKNNLNQNHL